MLTKQNYQGFEALRSYVPFLRDADWLRHHADTIHKDGVNLVAEISGTTVGVTDNLVVKLFGWRNFPSRILSPFMRSRAKNSWDCAHWLLKHNIQTPSPVCVYTRRKFGVVKENLYICKAIHHYQNARQIVQDDNLDLRTKVRLVELLAGIVRRIHDTKMTYSDLNLSNFLVQGHDPAKIYLIDQNRAKRRTFLSRSGRMKDIARMNLCQCYDLDGDHYCFRRIFLQAYSGDRYDSDLILLRKSTRRRSLHRKAKRLRNRLLR